MKRLHFTRCRTSLLAVLLAFSVAFVPVPSISDTSSNSAALLTTAQAAKKNTKNSFSLNEVPKYNGKASVVVHGNFDQAQSAVKAMFNDKALAETMDAAGYQFSSANSINIHKNRLNLRKLLITPL